MQLLQLRKGNEWDCSFAGGFGEWDCSSGTLVLQFLFARTRVYGYISANLVKLLEALGTAQLAFPPRSRPHRRLCQLVRKHMKEPRAPMKRDPISEMCAAAGFDLRNAPPVGTPEFNEWLMAEVRDPKVRARAAAYLTTQPEMREYVEQSQQIVEGRALRLLERPDFEPLLLSMREVAPGLDQVNRRTHNLHQLLSHGEPFPPEFEEQMHTVWVEVILDYLPLLLPSFRRARLVDDLRSYAEQQADNEAAESAYTALLLMESIHDDRDNKFLIGYDLRSMRHAVGILSHWKIVEE